MNEVERVTGARLGEILFMRAIMAASRSPPFTRDRFSQMSR